MKLKTLTLGLLMVGALSSCNRVSPEELLKSRVRQMAETAELGTIEATVKKVVKLNDTEWYTVGDRKILFRCTAFLKAGFDLSKIAPEDIVYDKPNNSVVLTLPAPQLLSLNMPAELSELAYTHVSAFRSDFSAKERTEILKLGEKDIRDNFYKMGLTDEAKKSATDIFTALLSQMGYQSIKVNFKEVEQPKETK